MLTAYLTQTRSLLQLPGTDSTSLYTDADLTRFINVARGQIAGEAKCIRALGAISTVANQTGPYPFASITGLGTGVDGVIHVRSMRYSVGTGSLWLSMRPWEWFELYELNNVAPDAGPPRYWTQYAQGSAPGTTGSAAGGSFYVTLPDTVYALILDCVCYPIKLVDDTTVEALPYLYTDCVPFFAAYYALMSAQTNARLNDAIQYYKMYQEFLGRADSAGLGASNSWQFEMGRDPIQATKLPKGGEQMVGGQ